MSTKAFCIFSLLCAFLAAAAGHNCYQCSTQTDEHCADPFNETLAKSYHKECGDESIGDNVKYDWICVKTIHTSADVTNTTIVTRECVPTPVVNVRINEVKCFSSEVASVVSQTCYCSEEGCNGGSVLSASFMLCFSALLSVLLC